MTIVYHGTKEGALAGILRRGLIPRKRKNHDESGDYVYVERSARTARVWATQAGSYRYVVIKLDVPDEILSRDGQTLSQSSLKASRIPAKCIKGWDIYELNVRTGEVDFVETASRG